MGQMTGFNREEVQTELREIIADAHSNRTLWTTDWAGMQLQRCVFITYLPWDVVERSLCWPLGQFDAKTIAGGKHFEAQDVSLASLQRLLTANC